VRPIAPGPVRPGETVPGLLLRQCHLPRTYCDPAYGTRDIVGSHRLEEHRWQTHLAAVEGNVGEALEELEELRRTHDRVGIAEFLIIFS